MSIEYIEDIDTLSFYLYTDSFRKGVIRFYINEHYFDIMKHEYIYLSSQINLGYPPIEYKGRLYNKGKDYFAYITFQNYWLCATEERVGFNWHQMEKLNTSKLRSDGFKDEDK